jgi:oligopeptide transport system ATP-binding protein
MLLSVRELSVKVSGTKAALAVDRVSFDIEPGQSFGLVGESGCGKTTTAKAVLGLLPKGLEALSGSIRFRDAELLGMSRKEMNRLRWRDISLITQSAMNALNPVVRVGAQFVEAIRAHEAVDKGEAMRRAEGLFAKVSLDPALTRRYPHEFSGGMRQRAIIAMALACNPALIIADEPTTALDVTIQAQILDLMRSLQAERDTGVIMITHSMGVVAGMADRVQVMYAGSIVETASTEEIFANPRHPYTVGLMKSIPRLDARERERLEPIRGLPPDLIDLPDICPFVPRCDYAREKCEQKRPPLLDVGPGHKSACWFWEEVSKDGVPTKGEA